MKKTVFAIAFALSFFTAVNAKPIMEGEVKIAAFGGSNMYYTQTGYGIASSYLTFLRNCLKKEGVVIKEVIRAGKFDQSAESMLARLDADVIAKNPDWVIYEASYGFSPGYNKPAYTDDEFRKILLDTYAKFKAANLKVVVIGPSMNTDDPKCKSNVGRVRFNDILREETKKAGYPFLDLFGMEMKICETRKPTDLPLTAYGSLYTIRSIRLIGEELAKLCGISKNIVDEEAKRLGAAKLYNAELSFSINEWEKITKKAAELQIKPEEYVRKLLESELN